MTIVLRYNYNTNSISMEAKDGYISRLRGIGSYIKTINGKLLDNNRIEIPVENVDIENVYIAINKILKDRFSCTIEYDDNAHVLFSSAEKERMKFAEFAKKAKNIRDNIINREELSDFCNSILEYGFIRNLKIYQLLAAYHLSFSQNSCNFSVPGSGKTSTVLAAYEYLRHSTNPMKRIDKLVVIGPLSSFIAWKLEYEECFGYKPNTVEIRGGIQKNDVDRAMISSNSRIDLIVISYGSVKKYQDTIMYYMKHNKSMLVLDEAHRIKKVSYDAQSNYVLNLAKYASSRVVLTGTPAANSYVDLYNLFKFIWPSNNIIGYSIAQLSTMSQNDNDIRKNDLINRISPFFIRVKKGDLGLPLAKYNTPIRISMSPIQEKIYSAIEKIVIDKYESVSLPEGIRKSATIRLRQAASNPGLLLKALKEDLIDYEDDYSTSDTQDTDIEIDNGLITLIKEYKGREVPNKFKEALNIAKAIIYNKGKVIIWCEFIGTCEDLSSYLYNNGFNNKILYGKCPQEEREQIIRDFVQEDNHDFNIIVANPHAVGESISLHKTCHNAIYLEQGFNAGVYMQSKDRIHRVGLPDSTVTNYYFIQSKDSVDDVIYNRVLKKESRMLELIESQEIPLFKGNLDYEEDSEEDIRAIIRDYYERRK